MAAKKTRKISKPAAKTKPAAKKKLSRKKAPKKKSAPKKTAAKRKAAPKKAPAKTKSTKKRSGATKKAASPKKRGAAALSPTDRRFGDTYDRLRALLNPYDEHLDVRRDGEAGYESWCTGEFRGREVFFAGVREGTAYVSFHFFPVYTQPDLLTGIDPALRKRMQGKSCFNFKTLEETLERSLEALIKTGFERYRDQGLV
jgi:hypothetical protein